MIVHFSGKNIAADMSKWVNPLLVNAKLVSRISEMCLLGVINNCLSNGNSCLFMGEAKILRHNPYDSKNKSWKIDCNCQKTN